MGWQSWDVVTITDQSTPSEVPTKPSIGGDLETSVDWWNVTKPEEKVDFSSLPLDTWSPTLPHDTGLSEIAVTRCVINPEVGGDLCAPDTTSEQDAIKGKWVRVPRNLNLEAGYLSGWLNIYYRRTRRQDINLITEIRLYPQNEQPPTLDGWHKAQTSLRAGIRGLPPLFLWYKTGKTSGDMSPEEKMNIITELDVLYGEDTPWYGFEKLDPPTIAQQSKVEATWITYRRGVKIPPRAPPLHFSHSGKFKVLQVADLHFSVSQGFCRDTILSPCEHSDNLTNTLISHVIDQEKPDLIVFTGDQLNGQGSSWDPKSVLAKFSKAVTAKGVPWAAVFGNHDEEDGMAKEQQVTLMKSLPYSLVERGPKDVHGVGNYVLKVFSPDPSKTHTLTLYFLDSGSYSKGVLDWFGFFKPTEYDWIHVSKASIRQIERPFTPDTGKDLGSVWGRQDDQVIPGTRRLAKPNALMFFHMPLPETYLKADINPNTGKALDVGVSGQEPPGNAKSNDGFFEKGILKAMESNHVSNRNALEVKAIGNGHCHITENCRRVKGVWFCFGGGGSYSGYGKIGFDRRFRIYDVSDFGETIKTYKRTEKDEIIDEMILTGKGAPPLPS
ncbi:putative inactive purple acid phosphatase 29 [Psilocybe cubensis]|uniref:Inactive purple acid phosphatase 29 n=1 Tax=Psilocybe cubensis TaxID=181762 RepID=A0ACB8GVJ9_PSICU|nr:putative inactive purple acid phosphatase 29 [Psilocybe cubensis]KAH9479462.1 putative inactive purple acid phosphatase 29 [Psilocybe cubensis]